MNQAGQVTGFSRRYVGSTYAGLSAWLYDAGLNETFPLVLSTRSDGFASSQVQYMGDDGLVLSWEAVPGATDYRVTQRRVSPDRPLDTLVGRHTHGKTLRT
jgi:hypothetical protein